MRGKRKDRPTKLPVTTGPYPALGLGGRGLGPPPCPSYAQACLQRVGMEWNEEACQVLGMARGTA
jgi:hypothetical protein